MLTHEEAKKLENDLIRDEGMELKAYIDTVGKVTIGVGRNLDDVGLTEEEARYLLKNDIQRVEKELSIMLPWTKDLDAVRYRVICNMCFNLGISRLLQFKNTLAAVKRGDYMEASSLMLQSKWASQVKTRAIRLAQMMRTGVDYQAG